MADLLTISACDNQARELDLVFVHGLDGNGRTTWQKGDDASNFWPAWLGEEYPNIGVWSLDYEVSASDWKGHSMPLYNRARHCLELFDLKQIGQRPIGFVCHSLGGLLVKEMLRLAQELNHSAWQTLAENTRFIVFLSTPHSGADLANWIKHIGSLLRTSVSIDELKARNPQLLELNIWYRQNVARLDIKTYVFCESLPTHGFIVVNETSADPGIADVIPIPLDEDHISICKLAQPSGHVYDRVKRLLDDTLAHSTCSPKDTVQTADTNVTLSRSASDSEYPGSLKLTFCERLGASWRDLADILEIKPSEQARFQQGLEPRAIWDWLQQRKCLNKLPAALTRIGRGDLAKEFGSHPT